MSQLSKLDTVWFSVRDMDRAIEFYSGALGLEVVYQSPYWSSVRIGESQIGLHGPNDPERPGPVGGWVVSVLTDDIIGLKQALSGTGCKVAEEFHDTPRGAVLSFEDPDGNQLQAMELGVKASDLVP